MAELGDYKDAALQVQNIKNAWRNCQVDDYINSRTLREWLNEEFINAAFTESEKQMILTVTVFQFG